jgi:splicing factor 3B subunit 5
MHKKYTGSGNADTTKLYLHILPRILMISDWMLHRQRDTLNNIICHKEVLAQVAIVENESVAKARFNLLEKMIAPCGPRPKELANDDSD